MVCISEGTATLGLAEADALELAEEAGVHPALLSAPEREVLVRSFFLDRYEVTNAQYAAFVEDTHHSKPVGWQSGNARDLPPAALPVVGVTWEDATAFAEWAGKRLPTEEEWEWAARGRSRRTFPFGDEWSPHAANLLESGLFGPAPVGSFTRDTTPEGVRDLAGNVSEWTASRYSAAVTGARVVRGGNWLTEHPWRAASFERGLSAFPGHASDTLGFRCALDLFAAPPRELPAPEGTPPVANPRARERFGPPATAQGPITLRVDPVTPMRLALHVPGLSDRPLGLWLPESIEHAAGRIQTGFLREVVWEQAAELPGLSLQVRREDLGYALWASVGIRGALVEVELRFQNLTQETLVEVKPLICLGPDNADYRILDPEQERTYVMTSHGVRALCTLPRPASARPRFVWLPVQPAAARAADAEPVVIAGAIARARRDGAWSYVSSFEDAEQVGCNGEYSCLHVQRAWPELEPGGVAVVRGTLRFAPLPPEELLRAAVEQPR
jgi:hypothetical protein